jgi:hypothetical protein
MTHVVSANSQYQTYIYYQDRRDPDHMVVAITAICAISVYRTIVVSSNLAHGEVYSIQHYVIHFVSAQ